MTQNHFVLLLLFIAYWLSFIVLFSHFPFFVGIIWTIPLFQKQCIYLAHFHYHWSQTKILLFYSLSKRCQQTIEHQKLKKKKKKIYFETARWYRKYLLKHGEVLLFIGSNECVTVGAVMISILTWIHAIWNTYTRPASIQNEWKLKKMKQINWISN